MRRWFLSYNSQDLGLMQGLEAALKHKDPEAKIFFAPKRLRVGGFWLPELAREIAEATAFILLVGEKGLGPWQVIEYYEALDRRVKQHNFPIVFLLLDGQPAPGLPFLRQLHWIITADPASETTIAQVMDAAAGVGALPGELWRHTAPYRGLAAMTEADMDFFFGRGRETAEVIRALEATPNKLPVLIGNSGVGKSSLAQAGVLAALMRQAWPETAEIPRVWPQAFNETRAWCVLTLKPGAEPVRALVEPFIRTWQFDPTDSRRETRQTEWIENLIQGRGTLRGLLDATQDRLQEQGQSRPPAFLLYVDQGEELYVRAEARQRQCFSKVIAEGLADPRLRALMSLRADFFGELLNDEPLQDVSRKIEVAPLREAQLREVVSRPAALLAARFESDHLAGDIAKRAAEESTADAGALPLLSYLLDDTWSQMVRRGDGVLRLSAQSIELGRVLVQRADAFLACNPNSEEKLRRIFTLKLATVREDGESTRRRALRSEFPDEEWRLVSELADHPNRLLVTATPEAGETYAEVAHEAIFRRWDKLREWIAAEREFLAWRSGLEGARRAWQAAPERLQNDALLMGHALAQAQSWRAKRVEDIAPADGTFILQSLKVAKRRKLRMQAFVGVFVAATITGLAAWRNQDWLRERIYALMNVHTLKTAQVRALKPKDSFKECTDCPEMIVVPAGSFLMGSPSNEKDRSENEGPQHNVTIGNPFAVAKFELTFAEWDACVAHGNCVPHVPDSGWGGGQQPVINVSWDDAQSYVAWLSTMTGGPYRLLTETEYEYATRAGTQTAYWWGDDIGKYNANCASCGSQWDGKQTAPVGSLAPNPFGLYDVVGNVWEWTEDCYHSSYEGAPTDGAAWTSGDCNLRVLRGGSWGRGRGMKNVDDYLKVRHAVRIEGLSERAAARRFGIDPRTVNKMMKFSVPPGYVRKKPAVKPKLDPFIPVIERILWDDKSQPKKQQHTAKRVFERLRDEYGFTGGITIVKDYVAGWRQRAQEMFVPLVHPPGHAQADFGEAIGIIGGVERKIHFFAFDLPHSDACFVVGYPAETTEAFCDGHVRAFAFFGGVPKSILYDNTKIAVARILGDGKRQRTRVFTELQSHYLFEDRFGRPGKGNDKGKVEGLVGYARRNFLVPLPVFENFEALNAHLLECCRRRMADRLRGHDETIGERLKRDLAALQTPLPAPYDACEKVSTTVSSLSLVRYRRTDYSVPTTYGHRDVLVRGYVHEVVISCGAEVIARHPRSYEREDFVFEPLHYLVLIEQKINALDQAAPLAGWQLPEEFATLRRLLEARMDKQGKREFVQVLRLMEVFRADDVAAAVRDAIARGAIGFDAVKHLVLCRIERRPPRLDMTVYPYLPQAHVAMTLAKTYLGLLTEAAS